MKTVNQILGSTLKLRLNEQAEKTEKFHKNLELVESYLENIISEINKLKSSGYNEASISTVKQIIDEMCCSSSEMKDIFN